MVGFSNKLYEWVGWYLVVHYSPAAAAAVLCTTIIMTGKKGNVLQYCTAVCRGSVEEKNTTAHCNKKNRAADREEIRLIQSEQAGTLFLPKRSTTFPISPNQFIKSSILSQSSKRQRCRHPVKMQIWLKWRR